jgi:hypothetical protein
MAQRADDIRHDIEQTRAAMTQKVTILEERVRETAAGVQVSVEKIVEEVGGVVKDVGDIVENVKATVDTTLAASATGHRRHASLGGRNRGACEGNHRGYRRRGAAHLDLPRRWSTTRGRWWAGRCWRAICSGAGWWPPVCGCLPGDPQASRLPDLEAPTAPASSARPQPQQGIVSGMLEQLKDEMKDEIASLKSALLAS